MSDNTHIEWTDATWNPITGCSVVSAGCKHCYAMKLAGTRLQHHPSREGLTVQTSAGPVWNGQVRFNSQWLDQPLRWKRPRRIFVCAHGDLFHESVPDEWIDRVFAVMAIADWHTFQVLTKRPERMKAYLSGTGLRERWAHSAVNSWGGGDPDTLFDSIAYDEAGVLLNVWLGVSVENQVAANERIPLLLQCPAAVRWISAEPLLGPVTLDDLVVADGRSGEWHIDSIGPLDVDIEDDPDFKGARVAWVVTGGESGTGARPMHPDWARSLRDQCTAAGVPFLFKQWGAWAPNEIRSDRVFVYDSGMMDIPDHRLADHDCDGETAMAPVGKKAAGRLLDGVLHDGYPT